MKAKTLGKTFRKSFIKKKLLRKASAKAQSAMEYLMTYSWAILIISVVLAALFQLGVFNPMTFAPKAPPGACQVFRPNGPYTTSFINLEGVCSGELPQYVAQFNGASSSITGNLLFGTTNLTISAWISNTGQGTYWQNIAEIYGNQNTHETLDIGVTAPSGNAVIRWSNQADTFQNQPGGGIIKPNIWYLVTGVWNGGTNTLSIYLNGMLVATGSGNGTISTFVNGFNIGGAYPGMFIFSGLIANVQLYNTSLSANDIQALYLEGIGGAPIRLQNLVGWWPLNGNANDYSGNGNNGQASNVDFVSNWYNGYTPP